MKTWTKLTLSLTLIGVSACTVKPPQEIPGGTSSNTTQRLYEHVGDRAKVREDILGILSDVGLTPSISAETSSLVAQTPAVMYDFEVDFLANGFQNGLLVPATAWAEHVASLGFVGIDGQSPLTQAYIASRVGDLPFQAEVEPDERLLKFVFKLGQERARRNGSAAPDPVWGDEYLDPLQMELLNLSLLLVARDNEDVAAPALMAAQQLETQNFGAILGGLKEVAAAGGAIKGIVSLVKDITGISPPNLKEMATTNIAAACINSVLFNTSVRVDASPYSIWRRFEGKPYQSELIATAKFDTGMITPRVSAVLQMLNCPVPTTSSYSGLDSSWFLDEVLDENGTLSVASVKTDVQGVAKTTYTTRDEMTPTGLQTQDNLVKETGKATVKLSGFNKEWPKLETYMSIGLASKTQSTTIDVSHYKIAGWSGTIKAVNVGPEGTKREMTANVLYALKEGSDPGAKFVEYTLVNGTASYSISGKDGDCTIIPKTIVRDIPTVVGNSAKWIYIDTSRQPNHYGASLGWSTEAVKGMNEVAQEKCPTPSGSEIKNVWDGMLGPLGLIWATSDYADVFQNRMNDANDRMEGTFAVGGSLYTWKLEKISE
ncbi:hypothetical protein [Deinococcus pimensis]|uniref:hypothetical protein n=1 Tax=Deinococcus pimensis TaxID=309888 RepID=UPI0004B144D5|nr:hypothetical protein [Deinococcus pimensis]